MTKYFITLFFLLVSNAGFAAAGCSIPEFYSSQGYHGEIDEKDGCTCNAVGTNYTNAVCNVCAGTCGGGSGSSGGGSGSSGCTAGVAPPYSGGDIPGTSLPPAVCIGGCAFSTSTPQGAIGISLPGENSTSVTIGNSTGQACTGGDGTITAATAGNNPCVAKGMCGGTVNGVEYCQACTPGTKVQTKTPATNNKTATNNDTGGSTNTQNEATKTTVCQNGACTTTITNNYNTTNQGGGSGGSGTGNQLDPNAPANGSTQQQKTQTQASFCQENPDSAVCKGFNDECKDNPNRVGCANLGTPDATDGGALQAKSIGAEASIVPLLSNASCPAPIPLPYGMSFDFTFMCSFAQGVRPFVLILAWLTAGMIVIGWL